MKELDCLKAIALGLLLLVVSSCQDDMNMETGNLSKDNFTAVAQEKMLAFDSQSDFDAVMHDLQNGKQVNYPAGFKSLFALYTSEAGMSLKSSDNSEEDDEEPIEDILSDFDEFTQLLNEDMEVMVDGVIYKISEYGTFFAPEESYQNLVECATNFSGDDYALTDAEGFYTNTTYPDVSLYNTFNNNELPVDPNKPIKLGETPIDVIFWPSDDGGGTSTSVYYNQISDGGTWAGKIWDSIWGFSKNGTNYFADESYRTRVKFYSLDFLIYAEAGVKTKLQNKGWFGIWSKQNSPQLQSGFESLVFEETWSSNIVADYFNSQNLPEIHLGGNRSYKYLGEGISMFENKELFTIDVLGYEIDVTLNDVQNALYNSLKQAGKFANKSKSQVAIRVISPSERRKSHIIAFNQVKTEQNTDKLTFIITQYFGFYIGYSL